MKKGSRFVLFFMFAGTLQAADGRELIPAWARPGQFRFARWDGGPLETAKAVLSGWPYFLPPNAEVLYATTNWYDPKTIDLLERAHVNWIWVTWSNGFSNESEQWQQDLLRRYIEQCQGHKIHVSAYLSATNIFWEDMFERVPESRDWLLKREGKLVPYGAASYEKLGGRTTRYLADISDARWQDYVISRALAAVSAGADGLMFDNNFGNRDQMAQFKARVLTEARKKNPYILVNSNYHAGTWLMARSENAITTEDGREPGVFSGPCSERDFWSTSNEEYAVKIKEGLLVLNVGLLRVLRAVSEGWRPVIVEDGGRHCGDRFINVYSVPHLKLALGEAHAFFASLETYQEAKMLRDLYFEEKSALEHWDTLARYNAFFERHASLYASPSSLADVAVVIGADEGKDIAFLNELAARSVI